VGSDCRGSSGCIGINRTVGGGSHRFVGPWIADVSVLLYSLGGRAGRMAIRGWLALLMGPALLPGALRCSASRSPTSGTLPLEPCNGINA